MDSLNIEGVSLIPLRTIKGELGNVMHAFKNSDSDFINFGEAYFSTIDQGKIKGWKKHRQMIMNIIVPQGQIKFVLFDDRFDSSSYKQFFEIILSPDNYQRLTVPPKVWMGFQGISPYNNLLLNIASILHNPSETEICELEKISYSW
jgi:dTDP-4-dehydrorhamnose 3,5-epimerase